MATQKKNAKDMPELSEHDAEILIFKAFKRAGAFLPQTPEEVEAAEAELNEEQVELPSSLRDPMAILDRAATPVIVIPFTTRPNVDAEAVENLGCAARNGSEIPAEVLEQMEADELDAEANRGTGDAQK